MFDSPFKGLIPYLETDAKYFFGRENDIRSIINNLKTRRLTTLYGESGVGKSSVLRAGVVHELRQEVRENLKKPQFPKSVVVVFPPDPSDSSASDAEAGLEENDFSWQDAPLTVLKKQIEIDIKKVLPNIQPPRKDLSFFDTLLAWTEGDEEREGCDELLIILDQFEQYFLYHPQESQELEFDSEFVRAINDSNLCVNFLVSIRVDELAKLDRFQEQISKLSDSYLRLNHLNRASAFDVITKPIAQYNQEKVSSELFVHLDFSLVEAVLESIAQFVPSTNGLAGLKKLKALDQIEAPYLQLVMQRLWKEMKENNSRSLALETLISLADKNAKDDRKKLWTAVKNIVQDHLAAAVAPLSESEMDVAASIFRYLVTPSGTKYAYSISDLYERYKEEQEDVSALTETIDVLEKLLETLATGDNRIVRPIAQLPDQLPTAKRYEIFHDVLARPILDWRKRYLEDKKLMQERQEKQQQIEEEQHRRTLSIKRGLATQSLRQQRHRQDELAALLARQSYLFNQQDKLLILNRVDDALRQALSASYFRSILKQHKSAFLSIAFSSDGTKLAAANADGKIYLWNSNQHYSKFKALEGHEAEVKAIAFGPDGRWLASGSLDNTIRLWDLNQESPVSQAIGRHEKVVTCVVFNQDGHLLASGSEDQTVKLWNWYQPDQSPIVLEGHGLKGKMSSICALAFSPVESLLAVGCNDRTIWLWDVQELAQTPDSEPIVRYGHEEMVRSVAFSPDGKFLASASDDRTIRIWDLSQCQAVPQVLQEHTERVRTVTFSPDGKILASASDDQTIRLWDTGHFEGTPEVLRGHTFDILSLAFNPDSQFLASCGGDNTVRLWDLIPPIAQPIILKGHKDKVRAIAISSQNQLLASGSEDGTVRLWNLTQPETEIEPPFKCRSKVFGVALFVSDDRQVQLLAAGSTDKTVRLWDLQQPADAPPKMLNGHQKGVSSVAFSPDGQRLASGSWDTIVRLWHVKQLDSEPISFPGHKESVTSVAFSPDSKILASASDDKTVRLWNVEQPDAIPVVLKDHSGRVWSIAFSPDGRFLASASDDWTVRLWNLQNLDPEHPVHIPLNGHSAWVSSVTFSPDGKVLASGSYDRSIRLWQMDQIDWDAGEIKEAPIILENHNQSITSVAFTPDGKYLVSGSYDHTIRLWIASTDMLADMVCQKVFRNLTRKEWADFLLVNIQYQSTCPNLISEIDSQAKSEAQSFFEKLNQLSPDQKKIFAFVQHRQKNFGKDTSWERVSLYLERPKTDQKTYEELETLRQLEFLQLSHQGTEPETRTYVQSSKYVEECGLILRTQHF